MKTYFLSWLLRKVISDFGKNPLAEFSSPIQTGHGWVCILTDKENGQEYLATFTPVEAKEKVVMPNTVDEFMDSKEIIEIEKDTERIKQAKERIEDGE